jgi:hypothetical protein
MRVGGRTRTVRAMIRKSLVLAAVASTALAVALPATAGAHAKTTTTKKTSFKKKKKASSSAKVTTITICVSKKGTVKVLSSASKKCAKGSKKLTWSIAGKNGKNGTNGTNGKNGTNGTTPTLRDKNGNAVGSTYLGSLAITGFPIYSVVFQGGIYTYLGTGQVFPFAGLTGQTSSPISLSNTCAGQQYLNVGSLAPGTDVSTILSLLGPQYRVVFRSTSGGLLANLGATQAWKLTGTTYTVPASPPTFYSRAADGTCGALSADPADTPSQPTAGTILLPLTSVPAPPDVPGPLGVS